MNTLKTIGFSLTFICYLIFHINLLIFAFSKIKYSKRKKALKIGTTEDYFIFPNPFDVFLIFIPIDFGESLNDKKLLNLKIRIKKSGKRIKLYGALFLFFFGITFTMVTLK